MHDSFFVDYVGFIKKIMKLMQNGYPLISKVEIELRQLQEEVTPPPTRPCKFLFVCFNYIFFA